MPLTDELLGLQKPEEQQQPNWVQQLIAERYQPKSERLKRTPIGFEFKRDPFDPSSYYKQLGQFRDISTAATQVVKQEAANREEAAREREAIDFQNALRGVNPNFTYSNVKTSSGSHNYGLKGVSSTTAKAANYFGSKYGIKTIGGIGPGSVPGSDHPKGRATDFMINNIKNGKSVGTALANDAIAHYKEWHIKYVIWNRYIWTPSQGWHKYSGPSPHTDHVHISYTK
jgi:hypothetical protein